MAFWNEEIETMPREELEKMQLRLIKEKVREMYGLSEFFRERMKSAGLTPDDINSFEDFRKVELRVAKIKECEPIKKAKKLLKIHFSDYK